MSIILVVLAVLFAIISLLTVNQATQGVWFVGLALLFGVFARIAQAKAHHDQISQWLNAYTDFTVKKQGQKEQ